MHALLLDRFGTAEAERWRRSGGAPVLPDLVAAQEWLAGGRHGHREEGQLAPGRPVLLARSIECLKQQTRISAIVRSCSPRNNRMPDIDVVV
jgi:hypothetical protein